MEQAKWLNNPRYQKAVQKMARLDPTRRAILDTVIADTAFADQDMRNRLALMNLEARKLSQTRDIDLREKQMALNKQRADQNYNLAQNQMDFSKDEADTAENLGWFNIGTGALGGLGELAQKKRQEKMYRGLADLYSKRS